MDDYLVISMSWRPASVVRRLAGHTCSGYAGQRAFGVRVAEVARRGRFGRCVWNARLRTSNLGDRGDDLPGHPQASGAVVPHHVVGDESEEWGQRVGPAESAWIGKLQDGLDVVAQVAASHGPPRTQSAHRQSRGGRDLRGWIGRGVRGRHTARSEEHTSELQSPCNLVCRLLLEKKKTHQHIPVTRYSRVTASPTSP